MPVYFYAGQCNYDCAGVEVLNWMDTSETLGNWCTDVAQMLRSSFPEEGKVMFQIV